MAKEDEKEFVNVTKKLEWRTEIESEGYFWLKGYFRGVPVVIVTATGIRVKKYTGREVKVRSSQEMGFKVLIKVA